MADNKEQTCDYDKILEILQQKNKYLTHLDAEKDKSASEFSNKISELQELERESIRVFNLKIEQEREYQELTVANRKVIHEMEQIEKKCEGHKEKNTHIVLNAVNRMYAANADLEAYCNSQENLDNVYNSENLKQETTRMQEEIDRKYQISAAYKDHESGPLNISQRDNVDFKNILGDYNESAEYANWDKLVNISRNYENLKEKVGSFRK